MGDKKPLINPYKNELILIENINMNIAYKIYICQYKKLIIKYKNIHSKLFFQFDMFIKMK